MRLALLPLAVLTLIGCSGASSSPVHPYFDITLPELEAMADPLPLSIKETIAANPAGFLERIGEVLLLPEELLMIADKTHDIGPGYVPSDLVDLSGYTLENAREPMLLRAVVIPDALAMSEAALQEGVNLLISSAYRSYEYQKEVYARNVKESGQAKADRESARPGASQHQLGTAVDFGSITDAFADTPAGIWLYKNAWKYGFSLSYPEGYESLTGYRHEIWHYRYITRQAAYLERAYFGSLQHYFLYFLDANREALLEARRGEADPS